MRYVQWRSVHVLVTITRNSGAITRCGRRVPPVAHELDRLPLDAKSCETCLRLAAKDAEMAGVPNDTPDPGPADDPVPG